MGNQIQVGDRVRSYDFDGRRDCYVEGFVQSFQEIEGCERYAINVDRVVFGGREVELKGRYAGGVFPPVNGTPKLFGGVCNGVEKLEVGRA